MAEKKEKKNNILLYLLAIPGIAISIKFLLDWYKTKKMMSSLEGMSFKNESKLRKQRNLYKDTLESAILKAASKIQEKKDKISEKNENITSYKDENIEKNEEIISYKKED